MAIKAFFGLLAALLLASCCYTGLRSSEGLPRARMKSFGEYGYAGIDTNAVYRVFENLHRNTQTGRIISRERAADNSYPYVSYLKFYPKGKFGLFVIPKGDIAALRRDHFDPRKAKMGYFGSDGDRLVTRLSTLGDCSLQISESKGKVTGDTLILFKKDGHGNVYLRQQVDPGLLQGWAPDW